MTNHEARHIIEDVLDTLVEVGNGVTDSDLHAACDELFKFRDEWFKQNETAINMAVTILEKMILADRCFCQMAIGNPMMRDHSDYCVMATEFLKKHKQIAEEASNEHRRGEGVVEG